MVGIVVDVIVARVVAALALLIIALPTHLEWLQQMVQLQEQQQTLTQELAMVGRQGHCQTRQTFVTTATAVIH